VSFSYEPSKLETSTLYQVRLNIGQTGQYDLIVLDDEEINFFLKQTFDSVNAASLRAIDAMISRAGTMIDSETGQTSQNASTAIESLIRLRDDLLTSASRNVPVNCQFTGFFEEDRKEQQADPKIFHDGVYSTSESPHTQILNGPIGT